MLSERKNSHFTTGIINKKVLKNKVCMSKCNKKPLR